MSHFSKEELPGTREGLGVDARRIRVLHIITNLDAGGAETFLLRLAKTLSKERFHSKVAAIIADGRLASNFDQENIEVVSLGMGRGIPDPRGLLRLMALVRRFRPDIVQTWLYHADFLGLLATRGVHATNLVWNIRCSNMDLAQYSWRTQKIRSILARSARLPAAIVVNSEAGIAAHAELGYRPKHWTLIENGVDANEFRPDADARARVRRDLGIDATTPVVGVVGRSDPMKDHTTFLQAAAKLREVHKSVHIVMVGRGVEETNVVYRRQLRELGLLKCAHLLGEREDVATIMNSFDYFCMPSAFGEGLPNAVAEAMAVGVPCVVTDVGDAARIVGASGAVAQPSDPDSLARVLQTVLDVSDERRQHLGHSARARVIENFSLENSVAKYADFYEGLVRP